MGDGTAVKKTLENGPRPEFTRMYNVAENWWDLDDVLIITHLPFIWIVFHEFANGNHSNAQSHNEANESMALFFFRLTTFSVDWVSTMIRLSFDDQLKYTATRRPKDSAQNFGNFFRFVGQFTWKHACRAVVF